LSNLRDSKLLIWLVDRIKGLDQRYRYIYHQYDTLAIVFFFSFSTEPMVFTGILLAALSGICNGLFTAPMKVERRWKWENIWFGFIVVACLLMPAAIVLPVVRNLGQVFTAAPSAAVYSALIFGFAWGFGAICFGRSVDTLGVSIANSLVIGLSSALGSLVPILLAGSFRLNLQEVILFAGVLVFLIGVWLCGKAGRLRESAQSSGHASTRGYLFAITSGVMSAVFNIGYALALPIAETGVRLGHSRFEATNCIWLLMLAAGAIPNITYCWLLMLRRGSARLLFTPPLGRSVAIVTVMGLLWGGSIFLYGAATPRLGDIGPSIGWPLSLAVGLLVANLMGLLLGEWRGAGPRAAKTMNIAILTLLCAIVLCAASTRINE
jgi:L-rhamnose-H+ transport protein